MQKIIIVTEAFSKTINGVWTTLSNTKQELEKLGYNVVLITPEYFNTIPCPTYPEIRIVTNPWKVWKTLDNENPDFIHIATEGPLALCAKLYCDFKGWRYSTSYHTKLPEYINHRYHFISHSLVYAYLRFLHKNSHAVLVTTESMKRELTDHKFKNLVVWGRGVDSDIFNSVQRIDFLQPKKVKTLLYVGRIAVEKNIKAFLDLSWNYDKYVIGDGPLLKQYKQDYPNVKFLGVKKGKELAFWYANCDVFVFPSLTDTFGIVMIEATRCGTPVAAYPVTGPIDYVEEGITGSLNSNLEIAVENCLNISREKCEEVASKFTWTSVAVTFRDNLISV